MYARLNYYHRPIVNAFNRIDDDQLTQHLKCVVLQQLMHIMAWEEL